MQQNHKKIVGVPGNLAIDAATRPTYAEEKYWVAELVNINLIIGRKRKQEGNVRLSQNETNFHAFKKDFCRSTNWKNIWTWSNSSQINLCFQDSMLLED